MTEKRRKYLPIDISKVDFKKLGRPLTKLAQGLNEDALLSDGHDHYRDKPDHDHYRDNGREWEKGR